MLKSTIAVSLAYMAASACTGTPHTTHIVTVSKNATCYLSPLFEPGAFCWVNQNNEPYTQPFVILPGSNATYNLIITDEATFDMQYALTCTANDGTEMDTSSTTFVIGATKAADPAIFVVNRWGANGTWWSTGDGEDYNVEFPASN